MSLITYTPVDSIPQIREHLRASFRTGKTSAIAYRKEQLLQLAYLVQDNIQRFQEAFLKDLGRPALETSFYDAKTILNECMYAYKHVDSWAKPGKVPFNINWSAFSPRIYKEPKGTVLIISPFNFPLVCLAPLTGAIAAGCAAVVKPSELTPAVSELLAELFPKYLDPDLYRVVNGGVEETTKLLELQWDHILYTGNGRVARIIATAAAKHLTPLTLELGGKSPVIVDANADFAQAAKRILWGKMVNSGQACVAPDYILVPQHDQSKFVEALKEELFKFYGSDPHTSDSFARICSHTHWDRIASLLKNTQGNVVIGGQMNREEKYIAPTIVQDVSFNDSLMKEEIFGPILPIVPVTDINEALDYIGSHDHPLAVYIFSKDKKVREFVRENTTSGSMMENDVLIQCSIPSLPLGGVGPSGYGTHKGKYSFDTFTHERTVMRSPNWIDWLLSYRFPPYTKEKCYKVDAEVMSKIPYPRPGGRSQSSWTRWAAIVFSFTFVVANRKRVLNGFS